MSLVKNEKRQTLLVSREKAKRASSSRFESHFRQELDTLGLAYLQHVYAGPYEIDFMIGDSYFLDLQGSVHEVELHRTGRDYDRETESTKDRFKRLACSYLGVAKYIQFRDYRRWDALQIDSAQKQAFIQSLLESADSCHVFREKRPRPAVYPAQLIIG